MSTAFELKPFISKIVLIVETGLLLANHASRFKKEYMCYVLNTYAKMNIGTKASSSPSARS